MFVRTMENKRISFLKFTQVQEQEQLKKIRVYRARMSKRFYALIFVGQKFFSTFLQIQEQGEAEKVTNRNNN